jgi:PIN domain nuclease of toxin-antitoxin system
MKILFDTHALLWWIHSGDNDVIVSVVSLWEIIIKVKIGKLRLDIGELLSSISAQGMPRLDIRDTHLNVLARLPRFHKDPFDHMLIAQSMVEGAVLMSDDTRFALYPATVIGCADGATGVP